MNKVLKDNLFKEQLTKLGSGHLRPSSQHKGDLPQRAEGRVRDKDRR